MNSLFDPHEPFYFLGSIEFDLTWPSVYLIKATGDWVCVSLDSVAPWVSFPLDLS